MSDTPNHQESSPTDATVDDEASTDADAVADAVAAEFAHFETLAANRRAPPVPGNSFGSIFGAYPPLPTDRFGALANPASPSLPTSSTSLVDNESPQRDASPTGSGPQEEPAAPASVDAEGSDVSDLSANLSQREETDLEAESRAREARHLAIHFARPILTPHTRGSGLPWTREDELELGCWIQYEDGWISRQQYEEFGWMNDVLHVHVEVGYTQEVFETRWLRRLCVGRRRRAVIRRVVPNQAAPSSAARLIKGVIDLIE
ncbi:hypothetical protein P7C70_g4133, partial [Phenoliferia sp. Uapishka_3]